MWAELSVAPAGVPRILALTLNIACKMKKMQSERDFVFCYFQWNPPLLLYQHYMIQRTSAAKIMSQLPNCRLTVTVRNSAKGGWEVRCSLCKPQFLSSDPQQLRGKTETATCELANSALGYRDQPVLPVDESQVQWETASENKVGWS